MTMAKRSALWILVAASSIALPAATRAGMEGDAAAGKKVFGDNCTACHSATTTQRIAGPGLKDLYKNAKLPSGKPVSDANVRKQIEKGGGGMPGFADSLSAAQIDDLIAYLKTL